MSAAALLDRLENVRQCGANRWRAQCPICGGKRGALAITERDDVVLLHCFSHGCAVAAIAAAVNLDLSSLFPPRVDGVHASKPVRRRFNAMQTLGSINLELIETMIIVGTILRRGSVTATEYERLMLSVRRVSVAHGATHD